MDAMSTLSDPETKISLVLFKDCIDFWLRLSIVHKVDGYFIEHIAR